MVVGLIRDKRVDEARKETNKERQRADKAEAAVATANQEAELSRQQAEQALLRAQTAEAELARVRAEYESEVLARIRRLEEFTGMRTPEPEAE